MVLDDSMWFPDDIHHPRRVPCFLRRRWHAAYRYQGLLVADIFEPSERVWIFLLSMLVKLVVCAFQFIKDLTVEQSPLGDQVEEERDVMVGTPPLVPWANLCSNGRGQLDFCRPRVPVSIKEDTQVKEVKKVRRDEMDRRGGLGCMYHI